MRRWVYENKTETDNFPSDLNRRIVYIRSFSGRQARVTMRDGKIYRGVILKGVCACGSERDRYCGVEKASGEMIVFDAGLVKIFEVASNPVFIGNRSKKEIIEIKSSWRK